MFTIADSEDNKITYKSFVFSGGEVQVKLENDTLDDQVFIEADLTSSERIMELALLVDALRRSGRPDREIYLRCPYLPYARQDRICYPGESLALRVFCDFLNSLKLKQVTVWDAHSDASQALINNLFHVHQSYFVESVFRRYFTQRLPILVSPDAGALKKAHESAKKTERFLVRADKIRDTRDGSITGTVVYSGKFEGNPDFLIIDDICDGGRTFLELAKELRKLTGGKIFLYVTHGIFSKGLSVFRNSEISHVYVANLFPGIEVESDVLTVIERQGR